MSILDSFKPRKLIIGSPYLTITKNGVALNKSAIDRLDYSEHVRFLFDDQGKRLAIQVCDGSDPNCEDFVKAGRSEGVNYVRWNNKELVKLLMSWVPDEALRDSGFKIPGEFLTEDKAFLFTFSEAVPI